MRSKQWVLAFLVILAGCVRWADVPKTSAEFRSLSKTKPDVVRVQKIEVRVPFRKAVANLQLFSDKCLNFYRHHSIGGGGGYGMEFSSRVVPANATKTELWLKLNGLYYMVTDVEPLPGDRTRLTVYSHEDGYFDEVPGWAAGKRSDC